MLVSPFKPIELFESIMGQIRTILPAALTVKMRACGLSSPALLAPKRSNQALHHS